MMRIPSLLRSRRCWISAGSTLSQGDDSGMKGGPLSADDSVEPVASTSRAANKGLEGSTHLLSTRVKKTSRVVKVQ